MRPRNFLALAAGILAMAATWAPATAADPIRIGVYLPMTGSVAAYGQMEWSGLQIAREMSGEVLGRKIELVLEDTQSDKIEAANAVNRLIEKEKVVGIIGEAISNNSMAGNPLSEAAGIPSVSPSATNPLVNLGKHFAFRACFVDPFQGQVAARFARDTLKAKTAAIVIDIAQDYCVGLANFFVKEFLKHDGQVVSTVYMQTGDRDFSSQLAVIQAAKPDVLYAPNYYAEDALIAKQAREVGLNMPILAGDGAQADALIEIGGKAVENMYFTAHFHKDAATTPRAQEYIRRYAQKKAKEADSFGALAADAYFLMVQAIATAGSTEGSKIRDALAATKDFQGVTGTITMGPNGNPIKSMVINRVENAAFTFVTVINP